MTAIKVNLAEWQTADMAARSLGNEQFNVDFFHHTGGDLWQDFVAAAHALASAESSPEQPYPQPGSRCLLCHQPLSAEATELLKRLWAFLEGAAQASLARAEADLGRHLGTLGGLDVEFLSDEAVAYRHLQAQDKDALHASEAFVAACRRQRDLVVGAIDERASLDLPPLPDSARNDVNQVIARLQAHLEDLENRNPAQEIAELESQKLALEHRRTLGQRLPEIERYVEDCRWIARANEPKVKRSTRHISSKYSELFDKLVTQQYLQLFAQLLQELNRPRHVQVRTRAEKGKTVKQIVLETHASIAADQVPPDKVLSEGEQRAVALADFLTEVALDDSSTGVILDDPVSSLDFQWKETIADHLVREAQRRQVIVFTHDLHFLHCLKERADVSSVALEAHWIERRDGRPGWVFLDNSPLSEKDYRTAAKARGIYERAKGPAHSAGRTATAPARKVLAHCAPATRPL